MLYRTAALFSPHSLWGDATPLVSEPPHSLWRDATPLVSEPITRRDATPLVSEPPHSLWRDATPLVSEPITRRDATPLVSEPPHQERHYTLVSEPPHSLLPAHPYQRGQALRPPQRQGEAGLREPTDQPTQLAHRPTNSLGQRTQGHGPNTLSLLRQPGTALPTPGMEKKKRAP
ncbi:unnamed protein product [Boreogadus saida]